MKKMLGTSLLLALVVSATALAQQVSVSGTVRSASGTPLRGVTVRVQGTETRATTDAEGRYTISAPSDAVLSFSVLGRRPVQQGVLGRSSLDVTMENVAYLEEVVVTAYQEQRRADVTGAVASVNVDAAQRQTGASVLQRLDATVAGVTVVNSGSPGSRSTVRIRGVSSFQNNDPLYVVDGVPVQDTYINWLNPNDITSVQVLKDASSASIYGSRASNGVVLIETTRKGIIGPPQTRVSVRTGIASPVRGYDDFLITDALKYHAVIKAAYNHARLAVPTNIYGDSLNPTIPTYTYADPSLVTATDAFGRPVTVNEAGYAFMKNGTQCCLVMPGSRGTNWWDAVFSPAPVSDYNVDISGGGDDNAYGVSFNHFNQQGTAAYNHFKRNSARVNTSFTRGSRGQITFGENILISSERAVGGLGNDALGEGGILGKNILMQPVVPLYDIRGNFASGKATTLGNNTNPLKFAFEGRNNKSKNDRVFGNVFAGWAATPDLQLRTRFGFNAGLGAFNGYAFPTPENSEPTLGTSITENTNQFVEWTVTNTATYNYKFMDEHNFTLLAGQEANEGNSRFLEGRIANLINTDVNSRYIQDALADAGTKNVFSTGGRSALLSFFGKADYNYADRYIASFTVRQDGSSRIAPDHRWGTFPAFGLGWRISKEPFMANQRLFSDAMVRFGWGLTGNQQIPGGRIVSAFGGSRGDTFYDIGGGNTTIVTGYRQTQIGNPDLKWEENKSTNVGVDLGMMDGRLNFVLDVFSRETDNLLFDPRLPATAGIAAPPIINVGKMKNTGYDFSLGYRARSWNATFNGSQYKNKIVSIDGQTDFFYGPISTRFGNQVINQVGHPIGAFFGYINDGIFNSPQEVTAHAAQAGKAPGRLRFRDVNGDGTVTLADRVIIGSPHPDFTGGLDLGARRGNFDISATVFGTFGNEIFDVQKEFYVFRNFSTNVRDDLLENSWRPANPTAPRDQWTAANPGAKYPILDQNDNFSRDISNFYVEDGSYVRLRNLQLGYNVPPRYARWLSATRVYFQAENLFTITGYDGMDPALPAQSVFGAAGDIRDQYRGVDRGTYPSNRIFSLGLVTSF